MTTFVRKNLVTITAVFTALDGSTTQPSAANISINYPDKSGVRQTSNLQMVYNTLIGAWQAVWDTSLVGHGTVEWAAWGYGLLQAATQGSFDVSANKANIF